MIENAGIEQRFAVVSALRGQVMDFCFVKMERAQEVDCRRKPARDREFSIERVLPKGDVERCLMIAHASFPITTRHRDLVEVCR